MSKIDLFKKLLPGFLPLFIFIAADEIWGTLVGLIVAVAFGLGQLTLSYIREKHLDRFVLLDTALIVVLGVVSILSDNDIYFKLKPAFIGAIFCGILGFSAFSSTNIMLGMSQRYMKGITISDEQVKQFNKSIKALFVLFSLHTLLVAYSAFFLSKEAWVFISGGLFYILFGVYFVFEIIKNKLKARKYINEEMLPLVDEKGTIIGSAPRSECHKGKALLHPVVHLHLINRNKMIYLQKRAKDKLIQPDKWDTAVGGHISVGDTLEKGLQREALEELGLIDFEAKLLKVYKWETAIESELVYVFICYYNGAIKTNPEEISEGKYWSKSQIETNLGKNIFTPNFEFEFEIIKSTLFS